MRRRCTALICVSAMAAIRCVFCRNLLTTQTALHAALAWPCNLVSSDVFGCRRSSETFASKRPAMLTFPML